MRKEIIQFQEGMSLYEFQAKYGTEQQCRDALLALRWPKGFVCPECGYDNGGFIKTRLLYQCYRCGHQASATAGTIFHSTKIPLTKWFWGIYFITQSKNGVSALELMRLLGVSYNTAWRMKHKIMHVMLQRNNSKQIGGDILIDDSYLGGEKTGGKRGRGAEGKTPFVAAVEMEKGHPRRIKLNCVSRFSKKELEHWSHRHVHAGSRVVSDGLNCFTGIGKAGCIHTTVITGSGKKSAQHPIFTWLNTVLGNLKNSLSGTYHSFRPDYSARYLAEFEYRFNRRFKLEKMIPRFVYVAARTSPCPDHLLVLSEN
jgi:transposase-like protein